ncbi:MAG: hypothetical protein ACD_51C00235G0001, partial [uncultured bacterium]
MDYRKPLPDNFRALLGEAIKEAQQTHRGIAEVVEEKLLRPTMAIKTAAYPTKTFYLPEGSCILDLAAALPKEVAMDTFTHAESATLRRIQPGSRRYVSEKVDIFRELRHGDLVSIEKSPEPTFEIGKLVFCKTPQAQQIANAYINQTLHPYPQGYEKLKTKEKIRTKKAITAARNIGSRARGREYLTTLSRLFGIRDPELISILCMDITGNTDIFDIRNRDGRRTLKIAGLREMSGADT